MVEKLTKSKVIKIVERTDKADPYGDKDFKEIIPQIHTVKEALRMVNSYGQLRNLYSKTVVAIGDIPFLVERAIIRLPTPILIHDMTDAGHVWSGAALELMRKIHPRSYFAVVSGQKKLS